MNKLPSESLAEILPYVGGRDFVNIRQTCRRLKDICDRAEVATYPVLWYRYLLSDFPRPMLESAAPWLYSQSAREEFLWKQLYACLWRTQCLRKGTKISDSAIVITNCENFHFGSITFLYNKLFVTDNKARNVSWLQELDTPDLHGNGGQSKEISQCLAKLRCAKEAPSENIHFHHLSCEQMKDYVEHLGGVMGKDRICMWTNQSVRYPCQSNWPLEELQITGYPLSPRRVHLTLSLPSPGLTRVKQIVFNESQMVILGEDKLCACSLRQQGQGSVQDLKMLQSCRAIKKIDMLGNLLVLLGDGSLWCFSIEQPSEGQVHTSKIQLLTQDLENETITDFLFHGPVFAAISASGRVYLSFPENCDAESVRANCLSPYKLKLSKCGRLSCISADLDVDQGLRLAVLEQIFDGAFYYSTVHLLDVTREIRSPSNSCLCLSPPIGY